MNTIWVGSFVIQKVTNVKRLYSRIKSTKSPSFCMTTFSASLTNLTVLLPQSHNYSCYVSRPILAPPPLWLHKHTDLRVHDFTHYPDLWRHPRLANVTCVWSWRLCGITAALLLTEGRSGKVWEPNKLMLFLPSKKKSLVLLWTRPLTYISTVRCLCLSSSSLKFCYLFASAVAWWIVLCKVNRLIATVMATCCKGRVVVLLQLIVGLYNDVTWCMWACCLNDDVKSDTLFIAF
jgi:hypothetical protein